MASSIQHHTMTTFTFSSSLNKTTSLYLKTQHQLFVEKTHLDSRELPATTTIKCCSSQVINIVNNNSNGKPTLKTCKNCKSLFDPSRNHSKACRFHTSQFGGETKSVYTGGTKHTPESGRVFQHWHCCGSEDPLDPG